MALMARRATCRRQASESSFCVAVNEGHGASQFLRVPKISKQAGVTADEKTGFFVRHFAGDVLYTAGDAAAC